MKLMQYFFQTLTIILCKVQTVDNWKRYYDKKLSAAGAIDTTTWIGPKSVVI